MSRGKRFYTLDRDAVAEALGEAFGPVRYFFYHSTSSTNDRAREWLSLREASGIPALIAAETQSAGRGRHGRAWQSPPYVNLLFSLALPDGFAGDLKPEPAALAAAEFVCRSIEPLDSSLHPSIKWPNDVMLGGKKIAGVLTESNGGKSGGIVIGVGINVNMKEEQLPEDLKEKAGSLRIATGKIWPREELLAVIVGGLLRWIIQPEPERAASISAAWRRRCAMEGSIVKVRRGPESHEGTVQSLEEDGSLILLLKSGDTMRFLSGEVTLNDAPA